MRFKIDRQKWLAAVAAAKDNTKELTKLYSIRAMARDRLHRKRAALTGYDTTILLGKERYEALGGWGAFVDANGTISTDLTLADQEKFIGLAWKDYEAVEKVMETRPGITLLMG